ncbi:hypothetical protein FOQG_18898 [Fusarium oxysporum f. sp. raphani 54005]|uniref:Isotrichodermin C-15 hydroxylase n=2 Tax=Fusarium oxysporum f. sp. raphani TaxID=96318 RepID=X0C0M3_FUSOX|nr:hypothetical protein FOQG_18898 [Fusarium oxysporum f. sp. raphani 54005]KAG7424653.1 Trichothecene C-15 hydroxylase [Fusarium oxysporum f. sp. raphani]
MANMMTTFQFSALTTYFALLSSLVIGFAAGKVLYNVFFHPLRGFPGPKLWAATAMPAAMNILGGKPYKRILELHKQYGDVVRIGPNELAFAHSTAWKEICGHLKKNQSENGKDPKYANEEFDKGLISSSRERHGPMRRVLSYAFSAQAIAKQQPLINGYIDLLMQRLHEHGEGGTRALDMVKWFDWTTFDIVGDLSFGEPFGCLQNSKAHPWVDSFFESMKFMALVQALKDFPLYDLLGPIILRLFVPRDAARKREASDEFARVTLEKRINLGTNRPDFVDAMLNTSDYKMSLDEMTDNCVLLTTAGSETTATTLAATTYFLGCHPDILAKLETEIRTSFKREEEIDIHSVQNLTYMLAVLKESMRLHPPVAISLARRTPPEGAQIAGAYVAGGTTLGIWQYALYHNPTKFLLPEQFIPERWLGEKRFANDDKDIHQPFSYGPRNCIGMNLAYTEMRLILARIIWNFDIKLADDSRDWAYNQDLYFFWKKPPLDVYLKPRV